MSFIFHSNFVPWAPGGAGKRLISSGRSYHLALVPVAEQTAPASDTHRALATLKVNRQRGSSDGALPMPVKPHQISVHLSTNPRPLPLKPQRANPHVSAFCDEPSPNIHKYLITGVTSLCWCLQFSSVIIQQGDPNWDFFVVLVIITWLWGRQLRAGTQTQLQSIPSVLVLAHTVPGSRCKVKSPH